MLTGTYSAQVISALGTYTSPITVTASGPVTLTRPAPASVSSQTTALLTIVNSNYVKVSGLTVVGMKGRSDLLPAGCVAPNCDAPFGGEVLISDHCAPTPCAVTTGNGITVQNFVVQHSENTCIKVEDHESGVTINGSTISDCGQTSLDHGIYDSGANALISGNAISNISGFGIHIYTGAGNSIDGALITGNSVSGCGWAGILDYGAVTVTKNVVFDNGQRGMTVGQRATVTHNIFYGNDTSPVSQGYAILFKGMGNDVITNNTFYQDGVTELYNGSGTISGAITVEYNIFVGLNALSHTFNPGQVLAGDLFDYNDYYQIASPPAGYGDTHSITGNPLLVNPVTNFNLQTGSPALLPGGTYMGALS